jgi:hypothetical protein
VGVRLTTSATIHLPKGDYPKVFKHPCQLLIGGATRSGKTTLMTKILENAQVMFDPPPERYRWFYTMPSSVVGLKERFPGLELSEGAPTLEAIMKMSDPQVPKMIVMDDMQQLMTDKKGRELIMGILHRISHHGNISFVFLVQNFVNNNMADVRKQCSEMIVMAVGATAQRNAVGVGNDMGMPAAFMKDCIDKVIERRPYGHLLISTGADAGLLNVRSGITPGDPSQTFFVPKGKLTTREFVAVKKHGERQEKEAERARQAAGGGEGGGEQQYSEGGSLSCAAPSIHHS